MINLINFNSKKLKIFFCSAFCFNASAKSTPVKKNKTPVKNNIKKEQNCFQITLEKKNIEEKDVINMLVNLKINFVKTVQNVFLDYVLSAQAGTDGTQPTDEMKTAQKKQIQDSIESQMAGQIEELKTTLTTESKKNMNSHEDFARAVYLVYFFQNLKNKNPEQFNKILKSLNDQIERLKISVKKYLEVTSKMQLIIFQNSNKNNSVPDEATMTMANEASKEMEAFFLVLFTETLEILDKINNQLKEIYSEEEYTKNISGTDINYIKYKNKKYSIGQIINDTHSLFANKVINNKGEENPSVTLISMLIIELLLI